MQACWAETLIKNKARQTSDEGNLLCLLELPLDVLCNVALGLVAGGLLPAMELLEESLIVKLDGLGVQVLMPIGRCERTNQHKNPNLCTNPTKPACFAWTKDAL